MGKGHPTLRLLKFNIGRKGARPIGFKVWLGGMWESELRYNIIHTNFNSALAIKKKEKEEDNNICLST